MNQSAMSLLGKALQDFQNSGKAETLSVVREDGCTCEYPVEKLFASTIEYKIDRLAIDMCRGKVLDVGAGAGRHSLFLQARGVNVEAIDISPDAVEVMLRRGVQNVQCSNIWQLAGNRYDTVLMLAHGLGITKTVGGLGSFLKQMAEVVAPGGTILAESLDFSRATEPADHIYQASLIAKCKYRGEVTLRLKYGEAIGQPFEWLHVDFETLSRVADQSGWEAEKLLETDDGDYLCRLTPWN